MKILITGATGLLGTALVEKLFQNYEIIGLSHKDKFKAAFRVKSFVNADIADKSAVRKIILNYNPGVIIHTAALSDVDRCEKEPALARQVNAAGTENVALACRENNSLFIYISTDYVFDGESKKAYKETDRPNPISIYGKTKLEGEEKIKNILEKYLIIRSSWLFGPAGGSFVEYIREKIKKDKILNIVEDKVSSPTYTRDLAQAISKLMETVFHSSKPSNIYGTYHITNSGQTSWLGWAKAILKNLKTEGVKLNPISLKELKLAAPRPEMTVLDNRRYINLTNQALRPWEEALRDYLKAA